MLGVARRSCFSGFYWMCLGFIGTHERAEAHRVTETVTLTCDVETKITSTITSCLTTRPSPGQCYSLQFCYVFLVRIQSGNLSFLFIWFVLPTTGGQVFVEQNQAHSSFTFAVKPICLEGTTSTLSQMWSTHSG